MTTRRILGAGPEASAQGIRAAQADLLASLPGICFSDLGELRVHGVIGSRIPVEPRIQRSLGAGPSETSCA